MNTRSEYTKILRIILTILVRGALAVAAVFGLAVLCQNMVLGVIFHGPSETARDRLTMALMASPETKDIPVRFLGQEMVDYICTIPDVLPDSVSDPQKVRPDVSAIGTEVKAVVGDKFTATVRVMPQMPEGIAMNQGSYYAGFTAEGVLVVAASEADAQAMGLDGRCGKILMMNGKINEGLMNATSAYGAWTALGQRGDGALIFVTTTGGSWENPGATYQDLIDIMTEFGAVNACCLSGGEGQ